MSSFFRSITPIWKDIEFTSDADVLDYQIEAQDVSIVHTGYTKRMPDQTGITVNVNNIVEEYLKPDLDEDIRDISDDVVKSSDAYLEYDLTSGTTFYDHSILDKFGFLYDWSYEDKALYGILTVPINGHLDPRMKNLITAFNDSQTTYQNQIEYDKFVQLNPTVIRYPVTGGTQVVSVRANENWSITSIPEWLTASVTSGTANYSSVTTTSIEFTATSNEGNPDERTGTVVFTYDGGSSVLSVVQALDFDEYYSIVVSPNSFSIDYNERTLSVSVSSTTRWGITSKPDWVTISPMSGSGDATVTIDVDAYYTAFTSDTRTGEIVFTNVMGYSSSVLITQESLAVGLSASTTVFDFDYYEDPTASAFTITSVDEWRVTSKPDWVTMYPLSGAGFTTNCTMGPNSDNMTKSAYTGTVVVENSMSSITLTVTQDYFYGFIVYYDKNNAQAGGVQPLIRTLTGDAGHTSGGQIITSPGVKTARVDSNNNGHYTALTLQAVSGSSFDLATHIDWSDYGIYGVEWTEEPFNAGYGANITGFDNQFTVRYCLYKDVYTLIPGAFSHFGKYTTKARSYSTFFEYVTIRGIDVTCRIEQETFKYSTDLEFINILDYYGQNNIPTRMCYGCVALTGFTMPDNLIQISDEAFCRCAYMTEFNLADDNDLQIIGNRAFEYTVRLEQQFDLPEGLIGIGTSTFHRSAISGVTFPSTLEFFGAPAGAQGTGDFIECNNIREVTIDITIPAFQHFEDDTHNAKQLNLFTGCTGITAVTFTGDVVNDVDFSFSNTFEGCTSLVDVNIDTDQRLFFYETFKGCSALTDIDIPSTVHLGGYVFSGCTSLTGVTLGDDVRMSSYEGYYGVNGGMSGIFKDCTSLQTLTMPAGVWIVDGNVFEGCTSLTSVTFSPHLTTLLGDVFKGCTSLTSVDLTYTNITKIGRAFWNCTSITEIKLPDTLLYVGGTFAGCTSLTGLYVYALDPPVLSEENYNFSNVNSNIRLRVPQSSPGYGNWKYGIDEMPMYSSEWAKMPYTDYQTIFYSQPDPVEGDWTGWVDITTINNRTPFMKVRWKNKFDGFTHYGDWVAFGERPGLNVTTSAEAGTTSQLGYYSAHRMYSYEWVDHTYEPPTTGVTYTFNCSFKCETEGQPSGGHYRETMGLSPRNENFDDPVFKDGVTYYEIDFTKWEGSEGKHLYGIYNDMSKYGTGNIYVYVGGNS